MLGPGPEQATAQDLAASEFLEVCHGLVAGRPQIDLDLERRVQQVCRLAIDEGLVRSAHDCSDGGLAVALAECCIQGGVGFVGDRGESGRWDAVLFGEKQSRIVVAVADSNAGRLEDICLNQQVPAVRLGYTGGDRYSLRFYNHQGLPGLDEGLIDLPVAQLAEVWRNGLEEASG